MSPRQRLWIAAVMAASLLAAGCSSGSDPAGDPDAAPTTESTSASPTTTATATATGPPSLPSEAEGEDATAALAFVQHWIDLINYGIETGDVQPARDLILVTCQACESALAAIETDWQPGGRDFWVLSNTRNRPPAVDDIAEADVVILGDITLTGETPDPYASAQIAPARSSDEWRIAWMLTVAY